MLRAPLTLAILTAGDSDPHATLGSIASLTNAVDNVVVVDGLSSLNAALDATGDPWFAVVLAGDLLCTDGFDLFATALRHEVDAVVLYTDEIGRAASDDTVREVLKPGWSPRLFREGNYIGGLAAVRADAARAAGGFVEDDLSTRSFDLLTKLTEPASRVVHVAVIGLDTSANGVYPATAGDRVWQNVRLRNDRPKVTIVIPTRDRYDLLHRCIDSLDAHTSYPNFDIVIVDNGSTDKVTLDYLAALPHRTIRCPGPFNFSWLINSGVAASDGELLLLLNNDTEMHQDDWLEVMVDELADPTVAMVGAKLIGVEGDTQHEGIALGLAGLIAVNLDLGGYCGFDQAPRDVVAVTAACVLVRRDVYDAVGGFDEDLPVGFGDVELCLRIQEAGYRVLYTPHTVVTHLGQASRDVNPHREDDWEFSARYPLHRSRETDRFVNPRIEGFVPLWVTPAQRPVSGSTSVGTTSYA